MPPKQLTDGKGAANARESSSNGQGSEVKMLRDVRRWRLFEGMVPEFDVQDYVTEKLSARLDAMDFEVFSQLSEAFAEALGELRPDESLFLRAGEVRHADGGYPRRVALAHRHDLGAPQLRGRRQEQQ